MCNAMLLPIAMLESILIHRYTYMLHSSLLTTSYKYYRSVIQEMYLFLIRLIFFNIFYVQEF